MRELHELLVRYWPHIVFTVSALAGTGAAVHAAMTKNDVRAAIGWVGITLFSPLFGALFYFVAGVNRIRRTQLTQQRDRLMATVASPVHTKHVDVVTYAGLHFGSLKILGDRTSRFHLVGENAVHPLAGGDEAYPAMLAAIQAAKHTIALQSYIFDADTIGREIAQALIQAHERGVQVRVLIDAVGARYSRPEIVPILRHGKVPTARFMTNPLGILRMPYANLRSHRKVLVVDGHIGFSGGMNIREAFSSTVSGAQTNMDTHLRIDGPVVLQLQSVFAHDWNFTTGEVLPEEIWFRANGGEPVGEPVGTVPMRCVPSGPDRSLGSTHSMLLGALAVAQHHVRIQSPYFLPDQPLIGALATAARRGLTVDIVIPGKNNLRLVDYAMTAQLDQVLHSGCRVWRTQGPFDHSKIMTVDDVWSYTGSSNLDPRSLRLNFELDTEIYDRDLAIWLSARIDANIASARRETIQTLRQLPFIRRLRNKIIWLATPYL